MPVGRQLGDASGQENDFESSSASTLPCVVDRTKLLQSWLKTSVTAFSNKAPLWRRSPTAPCLHSDLPLGSGRKLLVQNRYETHSELEVKQAAYESGFYCKAGQVQWVTRASSSPSRSCARGTRRAPWRLRRARTKPASIRKGDAKLSKYHLNLRQHFL